MLRTLPTWIEAHEFDFLKEEFCDRFDRDSDDFFDAVELLKAFFEIIAESDMPLAIMNKKADDLWHTFILFTPQYRSFCQRHFGKYIDHQPNTRLTPVDARAFNNLYDALEVRFGHVDARWLQDLPEQARNSLTARQIPDVSALKWSGWTGAPE